MEKAAMTTPRPPAQSVQAKMNEILSAQMSSGSQLGTVLNNRLPGALERAVESLVVRLSCFDDYVAAINRSLDCLGQRPSLIEQFDRPCAEPIPPEPEGILLGRLTNALHHIDNLNDRLALVVSDMERMI